MGIGELGDGAVPAAGGMLSRLADLAAIEKHLKVAPNFADCRRSNIDTLQSDLAGFGTTRENFSLFQPCQ